MLPDLELLRPDQLEHPQDGVAGEERQRKEPERGGHPPAVDDVAVENEIDVEEDEHGHVPHARLHGNRGLQLAVHHAQQDEPGGDGPRAGPEHHDRPLEGIAGDTASEVQDEEQREHGEDEGKGHDGDDVFLHHRELDADEGAEQQEFHHPPGQAGHGVAVDEVDDAELAHREAHQHPGQHVDEEEQPPHGPADARRHARSHGLDGVIGQHPCSQHQRQLEGQRIDVGVLRDLAQAAGPVLRCEQAGLHFFRDAAHGVGVQPLPHAPAHQRHADGERHDEADPGEGHPELPHAGMSELFPDQPGGNGLPRPRREPLRREEADGFKIIPPGQRVEQIDDARREDELRTEAHVEHLRLPDRTAHHFLGRGALALVDLAHAPQADADEGNGEEVVGQRRVQFGLDLRKARGVEDEKADHPARETGGNHKILEKLDLGPKQDAEEEKQRQESECDQ